ncbi:MAG: acireductone synthase [Planctomycetales bacterium]|nr:acireductone synthase [Planctomycetales bacterium]
MARLVRGVLLDIEGTTSSISFVHETMFPYVREKLDDFLSNQGNLPEFQHIYELLAKDMGYGSFAEWQSKDLSLPPLDLVRVGVHTLMDKDSKTTGLKALQGLIWKAGFESGRLRAHVFSDVVPAIQAWRQAGIDCRIYSSGSIATQKLFFGHLDAWGDCLGLFSGHYDTTVGGKKEVQSFLRIAADWQLPVDSVLFISDVADELRAAASAGMQAVASVRPGNSPLPAGGEFEQITSFDQIQLCRPQELGAGEIYSKSR